MTTRDRLDRRRSPLRLVLVLVASTLVLLGIAAAVAVALLPPVLAETPRERMLANTGEALRSSTGSATVTVPTGWLVLGVGPFLAEDTITVVSPDDAYRAEFTVLPAGTAAPSGTAGPEGATAVATSTASAQPAAATPHPPSSARSTYAELLAAHDITAAATTAAWNAETLTSRYAVRWTELMPDDDAGPGGADVEKATTAAAADDQASTTVLAVLTAPGEATPVELVLVATVDTADAAAYRTVTADLLGRAVLAGTPQTAPPTPSPAAGGGSS
jgi:hypothetical protein